jgi:hypothetical protein
VAKTLDLLPTILDLRLYVGDDPKLQLVIWTDETKTEALDLSSYTDWEARIKSPAGATVDWSIDTSEAESGIIALTLEGEDVRDFPNRGNRWDVRVVSPEGREITLMQGRVSFREDVST